ncbi:MULTISPECIES: dipeptide/oligopeptide/nickel ABC transporter ATP-binding protein [unclassified Microbacterium]|uniref:ATP-binding cassette domain-containing protein n=1 Tax=unclassified Microbacterium TaxID=2609290 RepID=UPI00214B8E59|nr:MULTISPECIES: dipeptide/oligopeptide/nickel ABC transporter ATP-binding protein [unclassified Microbacterium]MCR2783541.1 dipeptide/oligopeptide/nickel ABC transporter ATP-binding protein [Microbacterium sp. zg.B96]WIM15598.1 dipeptide/oligopeptide/nickel ABC transporter ATP-binding protein [Microbacterium sp. zg-B96]
MSALLEVEDLTLSYPGKGFRRRSPEILKGVSLNIAPGETLGLVGESGSGKTTLGRAVLGLASPTGGSIRFDGRDITHLPSKRRRPLARDIQVVFQDPYTSLNPALQIADILAEPLIAQGLEGREARMRVMTLLDRVGMPSNSAQRYPREFSGGQRQRVAIARALALKPRLIVCDEPVSALDLTTQARVMDLFIELQRETGVAYLFITHDLSVVRHISHRVAVMYRGELVETGSTAQVTSNPIDEYTRTLLLAAPTSDPDRQRARREARWALKAALAAAR